MMTPWAHLLRGAALRPGYRFLNITAPSLFMETVGDDITARLETLPWRVETHGPGLYGGYNARADRIVAPPGVYRGAVLAHELIHWTASRVGRYPSFRTGWDVLREEWVAELGTVKLLGALGHPCDVRKARARVYSQRVYLYGSRSPFGGVHIDRRTAQRCPTSPGQEWLAADNDSTTAVEYLLDRLASAARVSTVAPPPAALELPPPRSDAA